jgi:hypothetical protein
VLHSHPCSESRDLGKCQCADMRVGLRSELFIV